MSQAWMVTHTNSKEPEIVNLSDVTDALTLSLVEDYEQDSYKLASRKRWMYEPDSEDDDTLELSRKQTIEAIEYAKELAQKNELRYVPNTQAHDHAGGDYHWQGRHKLLDE